MNLKRYLATAAAGPGMRVREARAAGRVKGIWPVILVCLLVSFRASHAADTIVYVSESAADVDYSTFGAGYGGQDGSSGNPFGSILAAYHYLYTIAGNHQIRLIHDGNDIFSGTEIGENEFNNGDGYLRMVSGNKFPSADPSWTTCKLLPDTAGTVTLRMKSLPVADLTPTEGTQTYYPAAYEKEVPNPTGSNALNRGGVIRGLWNPGTDMALTGMIVENLDIVIGGGHVLIGATASAAGVQQQFTFNNCNVYLENDLTDNNADGDGNPATGDPWLKSALFVSHMNQTDLNSSSIDFNNSKIYLKPEDNSAWSGNFYVGQTWGSGTWYKFPTGFVDGNNTSTLQYWDGSKYVNWADLNSGIWQGGRNAGNTLTAYENGVGANNEFLVNFGPAPAVVSNDGGASNVTATAADLNGNLISTGGAPTFVWVLWGTNDAQGITNQWKYTNSFGQRSVGFVSTNVTGLNPGTTYYYRYYATNPAGASWASPSSNFTTEAASYPSIDNSDGATNLTGSAATLMGNLLGGAVPADVYMYWGMTDGGTVKGSWSNVSAKITMNELGLFSNVLSSLSVNTLYCYRCYASNTAGDAWADHTAAWLVKPIALNKWYYTSVPVHWMTSSSNNLGSMLGRQAASGLAGGDTPDTGDMLWFQSGGVWQQYWLYTNRVWRNTNSPPTDADLVIDPGEGFWIKRKNEIATTNIAFSGRAHTNSTQITLGGNAWTIFGWPYAPRSQSGWSFTGATAGWSWYDSDCITGEYNGREFAIYLRSGGTWCTRGTKTATTVKLEPGKAYYYYRRGGAMNWTAPAE